MRILLPRNDLLNDHVQQYHASTLAWFSNSNASSTRPSNQRVFISIIDRALHVAVSIYYFHLEDVTMFHVLGVATRYSSAYHIYRRLPSARLFM